MKKAKFVILAGATEPERKDFASKFILIVPKTILDTDEATTKQLNTLSQHSKNGLNISYHTDLQNLSNIIATLEEAKSLGFATELVFIVHSQYDHHKLVEAVAEIRDSFDHLLVYDTSQEETKTSMGCAEKKYPLIVKDKVVIDKSLYDSYQLHPL